MKILQNKKIKYIMQEIIIFKIFTHRNWKNYILKCYQWNVTTGPTMIILGN